jgi:hypothetical protein
MPALRRPLAVLAAAALLGSGSAVAAGCGDNQTREGNPGVEEDRLDQRREPPDASGGEAAPTTP